MATYHVLKVQELSHTWRWKVSAKIKLNLFSQNLWKFSTQNINLLCNGDTERHSPVTGHCAGVMNSASSLQVGSDPNNERRSSVRMAFTSVSTVSPIFAAKIITECRHTTDSILRTIDRLRITPSHVLRDITYSFWSENRVQDCAVRPVAMAAGLRQVIRPVIMATGRRSKRSKVKGHVGTAIQHSYLGRNQAAPWPRRCAPRSGFALVRPASSCWIAYLECI